MPQISDAAVKLAAQATDFVEVAVIDRDGVVESRHRGIAALTGLGGDLITQLGASQKLIYPRSAVKPIQAAAMRRSGLRLEGAELAICCGSHQGTQAHRDLVAKILNSAGLDEGALQCPLAWPGNAAARAQVTSESRLAFNCSGKHAGFLAASVAAGWSTDDHLAPAHPLQVLVREVLEEFAGEQILHTTVDGCGAPLHMMSIAGLARAIGKVAVAEPEITNAMLENPWAVGDTKAMDALVMHHGMIAKIGAEGIFVIGLKTGHGVAVKIEDGSLRSAPLVALKLLHDNALIDHDAYGELKAALAVKALGGDQVLGELRAV